MQALHTWARVARFIDYHCTLERMHYSPFEFLSFFAFFFFFLGVLLGEAFSDASGGVVAVEPLSDGAMFFAAPALGVGDVEASGASSDSKAALRFFVFLADDWGCDDSDSSWIRVPGCRRVW